MPLNPNGTAKMPSFPVKPESEVNPASLLRIMFPPGLAITTGRSSVTGTPDDLMRLANWISGVLINHGHTTGPCSAAGKDENS